MEMVLTALMKEGRKEALPYRLHALESLADVFETHHVDRFQEVADMLLPAIAKVGT